ncbi:Gfo/Idh/MocA family oxidoreductase [bacterium]|nr:Gfo/Idh/MocA family oxidoreductase [bacterium]
MDRVRIAVIGCGGISAAHINGILAEPRAELVYCVDVDEALAQAKAEKAGCKYATDWLSVLDDVDAVDICTPPHLHAEMTITAARAGKHVLCEKIMAISLDQAEAMVAAVDEAGIVFMVGFVLRYRREFMILNELCRSGKLGQIHQAYAQTSMQLGVPPKEWRRSVQTHPFGCFMSHGCHYVDQLIWHVGEIVETASVGNAFTFGDWIPGGDDTTCAVFKHENGAVSAYVESWATPYPMTPLKIDIYGKAGSARVEYLRDGHRIVDLHNADGWQRVWEFDPSNQEMMDVFGGAKDMHGQISHFVECIIEGKQPMTHGREGIKAMQVISASMEAERTGRIVSVPDFMAARE